MCRCHQCGKEPMDNVQVCELNPTRSFCSVNCHEKWLSLPDYYKPKPGATCSNTGCTNLAIDICGESSSLMCGAPYCAECGSHLCCFMRGYGWKQDYTDQVTEKLGIERIECMKIKQPFPK